MKSKKEERIGITKYNKYNELMTLIEYIDAKNILVQFYDERKTIVHTNWDRFKQGAVYNKMSKIGLTNINYQNQIMKIIEYNNHIDLIVEFQNEFKHKVHTTLQSFNNGQVKDVYQPSVCGVGICGSKYPIYNGAKMLKEYVLWKHFIERCYDKKIKEKYPTYQDAICCEEWLLYENFYEWIHTQENYNKWLNGERWALDKDILVKGNKIYSPETCCLVPQHVNTLFTKCNSNRGKLPIGVYKDKDRFLAKIIYGQQGNKTKVTAFRYPTPEDAFYLGYKPSKEAYIKQVAQEEYEKGNITKKCYDAMMEYKVEITD